jgi:pimeloyl-ACP methyl ester carboxylesterase
MLAEIDRLDAAVRPSRWNLVGSSMGGYLAARWAELRPQRVDRLLLLCPGFDLPSRWPAMLGERAFRDWQRHGSTPVEDAVGRKHDLSWAFLEDARRHPAWPRAVRPTRILHGSRDDVVPIESSRRFADGQADVTLFELDDDHRLLGSLAAIAEHAEAWFELAGPARPGSRRFGQP